MQQYATKMGGVAPGFSEARDSDVLLLCVIWEFYFRFVDCYVILWSRK